MRRSSRLLSFISAAFLLVVARATCGALVRDVPVTLDQPDGRKVALRASGDEYLNWLHDDAGFVVVRDPGSGRLVYARGEGTALVPTPFEPGLADPAAHGLEPGLPRGIRLTPLRPAPPAPAASRHALGAERARAIQAMTNLVVFVRFADEGSFGEPISKWDGLFNSLATGSGSMKAYFREASYGTLEVTTAFLPAQSGTAVVSYQDPNPRGYYLPYDAATNPGGYPTSGDGTVREQKLVKAAADAVASQIPASLNLDVDGDGNVDSFCLVVSGQPSGWDGVLWPHMTYLLLEYVDLNGKSVSTYNIQMQSMSGVVVLAHEMQHTLGAPDLYHYSNCSSAYFDAPVGAWDPMSGGSESLPPRHSVAHLKQRYLGWIASIPQITASGTYQLSPLGSSPSAYRIASPKSGTQQFFLEYRRATGPFEGALPGSGLLVMRVDAAADGEGNQCGPPDEVRVLRPLDASGIERLSEAALSADAGRTSLGPSTNPPLVLADGSPAGITISNVGNAGSAISFTVTLDAGPCSAPGSFTRTAPASGAVVTGPSTTLSWAASPGATQYDVYLGTSDPPPLAGSTASTSYPVPVAAGSTYRWKVMARNDCGQTTAAAPEIWTFSVQGPAASPGLSLPKVPAAAGSTVSLDLTFASNGAAVASLETTITASAPLTVLSASIGAAATAAGMSMLPVPVAGGLRLGLFGLGRKTLGDGVVATIAVAVAASAPPGTYAVTASGQLASDAEAQPVPLSVTSGSVTLSAPTLVLSGQRVAVSVLYCNPYASDCGDGAPAGAWMDALPLPQNEDFGYFYYGAPANPEVFVKVLDFDPSDSRVPYRVYFGGLTDFGLRVRFTVFRTGQSLTLTKDPKTYNGGGDSTTLLK